MTELRKTLPPLARVYVTAVVLLGAATVAYSLHRLYVDPIGSQWFVLAALTLLTGSFAIKVPSTNASLSVSETFVFASVLLFGAAAGAITVLLEVLTILFWMKPGGRSLHRILFNMAATAIAIWVSGTVFYWISGIQPYSHHATPLRSLFLPLTAFTTLYFLLNSWLVALALGFETEKSPIHIWWNNFGWLAINYFSGASVAALIVTYARDLDYSTLAIIVPLLVVSYLTFRIAMGRVEDSNQHLSQLNRLYLSTIETLAMAIDAKDQITHGHIRRVQTYAVGLAKHVGVVDETLIKAIEAAALLHDMGKLAVPEYILNKPGKLTPAEFEKMKLHASAGADILSAIDFPYPVVPIVRHHHESWDGTGYPDGLRGTSIPIGARILSVVDCYDALTSDRPYRPRLSSEQALQILTDRRGSMYDPLIVDTFARVHGQIAPDALTAGPPMGGLKEITGSAQLLPPINPSTLEDIAAGAEEMSTLYELARALGAQAGVTDTCDVIAKHLRRLIPSTLCVFYLYDDGSDELESKHSVGDSASLVWGLRIPLGQRLSGWVAANRQTILNSDPVLDLGDVARSASTRLRSCISTPMVSEAQLVGVLTLYSSFVDAFTEDHRRIIEVVAKQIAHTLKRATEFEPRIRRDSLTGLPHLSQLEQLVDTGAQHGSPAPGLTLLFIDVVDLKQINTVHGLGAADEVLRHVVRQARSCLRAADILTRNDSDQFVAVLHATDIETATAVGSRVRHSIHERPVRLRGGFTLTVDTTVTCVSAPQDGDSLSALTTAAQVRIVAAHQKHESGSIH
jgi:diguanylate cyclase (GGDEF)-like protein/putative nucleotidyltransferase with HDIG domain